MRILAALLGIFLIASTPAFASGGDHGTEQHEAKAGDHGEAAGGHDSKAGGEHHYLYTADSDGDGTPNWLDSTDGSEPNEHFPITGMAFHAVNLLLLLGILFYYGRRPINDSLANRALSIRKELTDSARLRDEAQQRNNDLASRLDKIESEIASMREEAEQEAAKAEVALIARAHSEAERIAAAAERSIRDEVQRARAALKRDAVALAVDLAESSLKERVTADHQQGFARDFLDSIKNGGVNRV